jgi:hypothetical protein
MAPDGLLYMDFAPNYTVEGAPKQLRPQITLLSQWLFPVAVYFVHFRACNCATIHDYTVTRNMRKQTAKKLLAGLAHSVVVIELHFNLVLQTLAATRSDILL